MPRNMSFSITTEQMYLKTKSVTRRLGWADLKPYTELRAVEKAMGLKKGDKIKRICRIWVFSNTQEKLNDITQDEVIREGFPNMTPDEFINMFCKHNKCKRDQVINRIEFEIIG